MLTLIPYPAKIRETTGTFLAEDKLTAHFDEPLREAQPFVQAALASCLSETAGEAAVSFRYQAALPPEAYTLSVTPQSLTVQASSAVGARYAAQTLRQLRGTGRTLPCAEIQDEPRFEWRGLELDESRHFFGKEEVKRLLDLMLLHKLNVFHWHLTDDQGWRIEIKKYPLLTEIGSRRKDTQIGGWGSLRTAGRPYGGFYTQEDIREIVAYASERGIMIVPEIDMPAHFAAAMAAYPWLGCREIPGEVQWYFGGKIPESEGHMDWNRLACAGKETTFTFVFDVLEEVCQLFPAPYLHIGGDEAPKREWEACPLCQQTMKAHGLHSEEDLQGYFNNRVEAFLQGKGKHLVGWNEILKAGNLSDGIVVQYWTEEPDKNVERFVSERGGRIIDSKHEAFYFDMTYAYHPLRGTYEHEPAEIGIADGQVLGVEGELWTEWVEDRYKLDMNLFPRIPALAEVGWSARADRRFDAFLTRWQAYKALLDEMGVVYAEDEIAMPTDPQKCEAYVQTFLNTDPYCEVKRNKEIRAEMRKQ